MPIGDTPATSPYQLGPLRSMMALLSLQSLSRDPLTAGTEQCASPRLTRAAPHIVWHRRLVQWLRVRYTSRRRDRHPTNTRT